MKRVKNSWNDTAIEGDAYASVWHRPFSPFCRLSEEKQSDTKTGCQRASRDCPGILVFIVQHTDCLISEITKSYAGQFSSWLIDRDYALTTRSPVIRRARKRSRRDWNFVYKSTSRWMTGPLAKSRASSYSLSQRGGRGWRRKCGSRWLAAYRRTGCYY